MIWSFSQKIKSIGSYGSYGLIAFIAVMALFASSCGPYHASTSSTDGTEAKQDFYNQVAGMTYQSALGDQVFQINSDKTFTQRLTETVAASDDITKILKSVQPTTAGVTTSTNAPTTGSATASVAAPSTFTTCTLEFSGRVRNIRHMRGGGSTMVHAYHVAVSSTHAPIKNFMVLASSSLNVTDAHIVDAQSNPVALNQLGTDSVSKLNQLMKDQCTKLGRNAQIKIVPFEEMNQHYIYLSNTPTLQKRELLTNLSEGTVPLNLSMLNRSLEYIREQSVLTIGAGQSVNFTLSSAAYDSMTKTVQLVLTSADGSDQILVQGQFKTLAYDNLLQHVQLTLQNITSQFQIQKNLKSNPLPQASHAGIMLDVPLANDSSGRVTGQVSVLPETVR